jgi:dimethylhistidine N-methyltransferase
MNDTALARTVVVDPLAAFRGDVLAGLRRRPRRVPPKYFYDAHGAALFDRICEQPEYYPTRAELEILEHHGAEISDCIGAGALILELGSGSGLKSRRLLEQLHRPAGYVPVDICAEQLESTAAELRARLPQIEVRPCCADFTSLLPPPAGNARRTVVFFPGSTIGNFEPADALRLLRRVRRRIGPNGGLLVGVDTRKDTATLERAYNDAAGVTAAFNLNLLARIDRELGGDFDPQEFEHQAFYAPWPGRIEMHLRSRRDQIACVDRQCFSFRAGETLHTENSYKYDLAEFAALAADAGFGAGRVWQDRAALFSVHYLPG